MAAPSYIPAKNADFKGWLLNLSTLITAAPATYGLTAPDAVIIAAENTAYAAAYTAANDPSTRTSVTVAAADAARNHAESVVRPYCQQVAKDPAVSDADKIALGLNPPNPTRPPIPAPTAAPIVSILSATNLVLTCASRANDGSTGKAKPVGAIGIQYRIGVGTAPAIDPSQCDRVEQVTKTPFTFAFDASERGKQATIFGRYYTRGGPAGVAQYGPWSDPVTGFIA